MQRRRFIYGAALSAVLLALGLAPARAQDPVVFGVIVPLSPPGETALGQLAKRGAEIGAEYINEKGGVLGRKLELSIHDSAGKNEQGVAAYRRLVSSEKAVAVFGFIHSGVNIAVNEVAKEMGVPTMGTQTGAGDVTAKHYDIAFRTHAVDRRAPPPGSAGSRRTSGSASASSPRPPTTASASPRRPRSRTRTRTSASRCRRSCSIARRPISCRSFCRSRPSSRMPSSISASASRST